MSAGLLLAWASPKGAETEAEFNAWYDDVHIPQVRAAVPSITAVHRYRTAAISAGAQPGQSPHLYLAVYELDSADVEAAAAALGAGVANGRIAMTSALDLEQAPPVSQFYQGLAAGAGP